MGVYLGFPVPRDPEGSQNGSRWDKFLRGSLIQLNINDWKNSTCTCKYFSKKYFCSHIIVVAVGLRLVTIPENCKNVNIGNLKKRGRVSNALRGTPLKTQSNVI